jgi:23S rRNA (adenine2503-C2)-methyltransferase
MGCVFCASAIGGKRRNLVPSEMYGQVIVTEKESGKRISGIVLMGTGEPLDNYDNVIKFLRIVNSEYGKNIGYRHISLSTCGLADKIYKLKDENIPITLSVSLHAATDEKRSAVMPVNKKYNLESLLTACADYFRATGRRISFEYALINNENDSTADAFALSLLLKKYLPDMPIHVNLIRVNKTERGDFTPPTSDSAQKFAKELEKRGITCTVRRKLGDEINAACGQLRAKTLQLESYKV